MGLTSGPRGVKQMLQKHYQDAFYRAPWLSLAIRDFNFPENRTAIIKDGNVLTITASYIPNLCRFDDYVHKIKDMCKTALRHSQYVIICIDDVDSVPSAKLETQQRRDAAQKQSAQCSIQTDDYTLDDLLHLEDCSVLFQSRSTRYRLIDELFKRVLACIEVEMSMMDELDDDDNPIAVDSHLIIDGIDSRGASRDAMFARRPVAVGTHSSLVETLNERRAQMPVGEADIKMIDVDRLIREFVHRDLLDIDVVIHDTIDTDAIPICILEHARRGVGEFDGPDGSDRPYTYITFRERGAQACKQLKEQESKRQRRFDACSSNPAGILMLDVSAIYRMLLFDLLGTQWHTFNNELIYRICQLCVGSWVMGGCDFVQKICHADTIHHTIVDYTTRKRKRDLLNTSIPQNSCLMIDNCIEWSTFLNKMLQRTGECESTKKQAVISRVAWTLAYWSFQNDSVIDDVSEWEFAYDSRRGSSRFTQQTLVKP